MTDLVHLGPLAPLTVADRCDRCRAQARVRVRIRSNGLPLDLCGHHFTASEALLWSLCDAILDERDDVLPR